MSLRVTTQIARNLCQQVNSQARPSILHRIGNVALKSIEMGATYGGRAGAIVGGGAGFMIGDFLARNSWSCRLYLFIQRKLSCIQRRFS